MLNSGSSTTLLLLLLLLRVLCCCYFTLLSSLRILFYTYIYIYFAAYVVRFFHTDPLALLYLPHTLAHTHTHIAHSQWYYSEMQCCCCCCCCRWWCYRWCCWFASFFTYHISLFFLCLWFCSLLSISKTSHTHSLTHGPKMMIFGYIPSISYTTLYNYMKLVMMVFLLLLWLLVVLLLLLAMVCVVGFFFSPKKNILRLHSKRK